MALDVASVVVDCAVAHTPRRAVNRNTSAAARVMTKEQKRVVVKHSTNSERPLSARHTRTVCTTRATQRSQPRPFYRCAKEHGHGCDYIMKQQRWNPRCGAWMTTERSCLVVSEDCPTAGDRRLERERGRVESGRRGTRCTTARPNHRVVCEYVYGPLHRLIFVALTRCHVRCTEHRTASRFSLVSWKSTGGTIHVHARS